MEIKMPIANELRIARICWNTKKWVEPSGKNGKSKLQTTYEWKYGFGHEEWLFDFGKIIEGYHYAFLQEINNALKKYRHKTMDIVLYTKEEGKNPILIGLIKNVYCINKKTSDDIFDKYKKNGWHKTMIDQVNSVGGDDKELDPKYSSGYVNGQFFNIRFKPTDVCLLDEKSDVSYKWFEKIKCFRYILLTAKDKKLIRKTFHI